MDAKQFELEALRRMTAEAKLAVMRSLIQQAYTLKASGLRSLYPDLPEEEIQTRARRLVGGDGP